MKKKLLTAAESINQALKLSMQKDKNLICYGLGATDPAKIFNTTQNLLENLERKEYLMCRLLKML